MRGVCATTALLVAALTFEAVEAERGDEGATGPASSTASVSGSGSGGEEDDKNAPPWWNYNETDAKGGWFWPEGVTIGGPTKGEGAILPLLYHMSTPPVALWPFVKEHAGEDLGNATNQTLPDKPPDQTGFEGVIAFPSGAHGAPIGIRPEAGVYRDSRWHSGDPGSFGKPENMPSTAVPEVSVPFHTYGLANSPFPNSGVGPLGLPVTPSVVPTPEHKDAIANLDKTAASYQKSGGLYTANPFVPLNKEEPTPESAFLDVGALATPMFLQSFAKKR